MVRIDCPRYMCFGDDFYDLYLASMGWLRVTVTNGFIKAAMKSRFIIRTEGNPGVSVRRGPFNLRRFIYSIKGLVLAFPQLTAFRVRMAWGLNPLLFF